MTVALVTPAAPGQVGEAVADAGEAQTEQADEVLIPADPLAVLDGDLDGDTDDLALLDPPHMAYDNVDDSVWLAVYDNVIQNKISL